MSDRDENDDLIQNPETRTRRAWVASALQGVRRRLESGEMPSAGPIPAAEAPPRPRLSVVPSAHKR
ncbi:MAG: hypothetical protein U1F72_00245 [Gammaproteobacteria bacterium]